MSLQNILVHLEHTPQSGQRFNLALALAEQHRCLLSGFYPISPPYFSREFKENELAALKVELSARAQARGVRLQWLQNDDWRTTLSVAEQLILQAYYADLVVIGKPDAAGGPRNTLEIPERLVTGSGTPVLITPSQGAFQQVPERVVVAWRAGRASVRSLRDALPLLQQARHVRILNLLSGDPRQDEGQGSLEQLQAHLARHGVEAQTERLTAAGVGMGDELLSRAVDESADLLVAGGFAYKQPMPVAAHLVRHTTIPVFMAN